MTFTPIRKVLFNRHISIAALAILTTACFPHTANAFPVKLEINPAVTFDFKGCRSRSQENDIVCQGIFRSNSGEQTITVERNRFTATSITDSNGGVHVADKIFIGDSYFCGEPCVELSSMKLVEGVNYKTAFVFQNIYLPSSRIPLLEIGGLNFKARNINIQSSNSQNNSPQQTASSNSDGGRYQSSVTAYKSGISQVVIAGLNARQGYLVRANIFNGKTISKMTSTNSCGEIVISNVSNRIQSFDVGKQTVDITVNMMNLPMKNYEGCGR